MDHTITGIIRILDVYRFTFLVQLFRPLRMNWVGYLELHNPLPHSKKIHNNEEIDIFFQKNMAINWSLGDDSNLSEIFRQMLV